MAKFGVTERGDDGYGRLGRIDVSPGPVETPALFPVINLIGGTTEKSGGIWRRVRDRLISRDHLQGIMFQAMSFTDYRVSAHNLNEFWRTETFHERFDDLNAPVFIDSGGFKLMNSNTFGERPSEGGTENEWGLYTNPESILGLQLDFGADIIATLDYPIPPDLKPQEKRERVNKSVDSAVECLQLLEDPTRIDSEMLRNEQVREQFYAETRDDTAVGKRVDPVVYIALHGHDYEDIHSYVMKFMERAEAEGLSDAFDGFAIGSLVPLRSSVDKLVEIVLGAKDAIEGAKDAYPGSFEDVGLHVFGIGGKQVGLLSLLGVDSFDCSSHMMAAKFKKYLIPETWERATVDELEEYLEDGEFPCTLEHCPLCGPDSGIEYDLLREELSMSLSYDEREARKERGEWIKSDYYAFLARHNFEVYNDEMGRVREAISDGRLLDYVVEFAREHPNIKKGLKEAQVYDRQLRRDLESRGATDLLVGPDLMSDQKRLSNWGGGVDELDETRSISLKHNPHSFNVLQREFSPPADRDVLMFIPCSQAKPYSTSRTHSVLRKKLGDRRDRIHKVTVSGMYGPVPEECESEEPVLEYEYVLANEDTQQIELVTKRLTEYLETHGDEYDHIVGYVASKNYRQAIADAFDSYGRGELFPREPRALQLTEHFRNTNIDELLAYLDSHPADESASTETQI